MKKFTSAILVSIFCLAAIAQHGVDPNWGEEMLLPISDTTKKQRGVLYNNMVTTNTGRIIISTSEVNPSNTNLPSGHYLTYSNDGGTTWFPQQLFTPAGLVIGGGGVKLAMDSEDTLFVLWSSVSPSAIFISILDKNLTVIKDSIRVASQQTYGNFATHFSIDRYDRIHVMWHEGSPGTPEVAEAFYTRSTDGGYTWEPVQALSDSSDGRHSAFPHAEFDVAGDTLCIAWRDSVDASAKKWDVYGVFSTNGGATWGTPQPLESSNNTDWDPDVLIDNQGRVHLFYHVYPTLNPFSGAHIKYKYTDNVGMSWQTSSNPSGGQLSEDSMRSQLVEGCRYDTQNNILWLTWKDERDFDTGTGNAQGDMMAAYSTDRGLTWSLPEFITDRYDSTVAFKAGALLPAGEFCVNYEVISPGDINDPNGFLRVYFRKRQQVNVSVPEMVNANSFQIYPNPANRKAIIEFNDLLIFPCTVTICNSQGKVLRKRNDIRTATIEIETVDLPCGLYFIHVQSDKQVIRTNKLIIAD